MRLPKSVRVGKEEVRVIRHTLGPHEDPNKRRAGHAMFPEPGDKIQERTITVGWGLDESLVLATYLHEIIHQCCFDLAEEAVEKIEAAMMTALVRLDPKRGNWEWNVKEARWVARRK